MIQKTASDEIDLMELLARGYRAIKRNFLIFIILPLAGLVLTLSLSYNSGRKYASSMMITTNLLSEQEAKFIFKELEKSGSIPGLSEEENDKLVWIRFDVERGNGIGINDLKLAATGQVVYLTITAEVTDPAVFHGLESKLIEYLNKVGPVVQNRANQVEYYREMIKKIDQEIAAMDQIKASADNRALASYVDPSDLFAKTVELFKERTDNEIRLKNMQTVQITKGFGSLIKDSKLPKSVVGLIGLIAGFMLAVGLLFVKHFNSYNRSLKLEE